MDTRFLFLEFEEDFDDNYFIFNEVRIINKVNKVKTPLKILKGNVMTIFNLSYSNFIKGEMYLTFDFKSVYYIFPLTNKEQDINTFFMNDFIVRNLKNEKVLQINEDVIKYKEKDVFVINDYDIYDGQGLPCIIKKRGIL